MSLLHRLQERRLVFQQVPVRGYAMPSFLFGCGAPPPHAPRSRRALGETGARLNRMRRQKDWGLRWVLKQD